MPLVGGARLPLAFIGGGLIAFAAALAWQATRPTLLLTPYLHPHVVALAHLWLPGFLLSVTIGAFYQLMPVVTGAPLRASDRGLWLHLVAHLAGVSAMVVGFTRGRYDWVGVGGLFVSAGVLYLGVVTWRTFARAAKRDAPAWSFPLAAGWLAATVIAGVLLAFHKRHPFLPLSAADLLKAHAHLGLAGFFLTLLQGVTFQLVPMFTMGERRKPRLVWAGLIATQCGQIALAPALTWGWTWAGWMGAALLTGGVVCSGVALVATLGARRRRRLEPGLLAFMIGAVLLGVALATGLTLRAIDGVWPQVVTSYGLVIVPGALSLMVLGMGCKIVPFLVWMRAYGPKVGKEPVPLATALASRKFEYSWLAAHMVGLAVLIVAVIAANAFLAGAGAWLLAAGGLVLLINFAGVFAHLRTTKRKTISL
jgi:hypothetical protein